MCVFLLVRVRHTHECENESAGLWVYACAPVRANIQNVPVHERVQRILERNRGVVSHRNRFLQTTRAKGCRISGTRLSQEEAPRSFLGLPFPRAFPRSAPPAPRAPGPRGRCRRPPLRFATSRRGKGRERAPPSRLGVMNCRANLVYVRASPLALSPVARAAATRPPV